MAALNQAEYLWQGSSNSRLKICLHSQVKEALMRFRSARQVEELERCKAEVVVLMLKVYQKYYFTLAVGRDLCNSTRTKPLLVRLLKSTE